MKTNQIYEQRVNNYKNAVKFKNNKILTAYGGPATPAKFMNIKMKDFIFDTKLGFDAYIKYINKLNELVPIDCLNTPYPGKMHVFITLLWFSKVKAPGRELSDDSLWQVDERAVLQIKDYDFIIKNGFYGLRDLILPKVIDMDELANFMEYLNEEGPYQAKTFVENGYPIVNGMAIAPPFEVLCGARSMAQFYNDCYKMFDKIKETQDAMMPQLIDFVKNTMKGSNALGAWVGGWRGASALVSPKIWDTLVWPYMKTFANMLLKENYIPIFHLDQNWDRDIDRFLEIPKQSCVLNTDGMTNLKIARKKLGDHVAFLGDVPAPLLSTASAQEVADYVKRLIDDVGPKGLIISSGCDAPPNAKFDNMVAMYKTAAEYK